MEKKDEIITLSLDSIIPYENNPRDNDASVPFVAKSIEKFGYNSKIEVNDKHVVLIGHTRLKALKLLQIQGKLGKGRLEGLSEGEIPVVVRYGLSEAEQKEYRLSDNKTSEKSVWKLDGLNIELKEIGQLDPLFKGEDFGFDTVEDVAVDNIISDEKSEPKVIEVDGSSDDVPDVFVLNVYFDDSAEAYALMDRLKDEGYRCKIN